MTIAEKQALAALLKLNEADFTEDQKTQHASLVAKADADGIDYNNTEFLTEFGEKSTETDETELASLISKAVGTAVTAAGMDQGEVVKALQAEIAKNGKDALTADAIDAIVQKHLGGASLDQDALVSSIKAAIPTNSLTSEGLATELSKFASTIRKESKMIHSAPASREFPVEHRGGNLSVAEKQLLNLCVRDVSEERKEEIISKGGSIPKNMNDGITDEQLTYAKSQGVAQTKKARNMARYGKALTSTVAGSGLELIPTDLSSELLTRMQLESQIAAEFLSSEIDMPTNPFIFPMTTSRTQFYTGSEGGATTENTPTTADLTLKAAKLIGLSSYSYEADEDAIIATLPLMIASLAEGAADALEGALINGDDTATHMDTDTTGTNHAKLLKGLRYYAVNGSSVKTLSGGITSANIAAMKAQMGKYGIKPRDLMIVCGVKGYNDIVGLPETLTADKVGSDTARILTGEAGSIHGVRIVISSQCREDVAANGLVDGVTSDQGTILMVHRPSWLMGVRRGFTVEVEVDKRTQMNSVIASFRRAFMPLETPSAALPMVVAGIGYTA